MCWRRYVLILLMISFVVGSVKHGEPSLIYPTGVQYVDVEIGKGIQINCTVYTGETAELPYWLNGTNFISNSRFTEISEKPESNIAFEILKIEYVVEEDLLHNYTCILPTIYNFKKGTVILKKVVPPGPDISHLSYYSTMSAAAVVPVIIILMMALYLIYRVDIVLFYRKITGKNETFEDGKEYDAYVSYLRRSNSFHSTADDTIFAMEILPHILEDHFGYQLCIFERDISPGGGSFPNNADVILKPVINFYMDMIVRLKDILPFPVCHDTIGICSPTSRSHGYSN
ncbi:interleukin-18 receptor 1-like [Protopterus annectens]|uniref:interleukin-18 receptor 1-like n=1 Tax=Protopterus annectens TaxID=7888 RepID=UPI001CF9390B|nr:interleukin-18 receptor 1-like [Protopterus annectens]